LGKSGLEVSAIGLGCMGMSHGFGSASDMKEMITLWQIITKQGAICLRQLLLVLIEFLIWS